jgi:hypothetical protein
MWIDAGALSGPGLSVASPWLGQGIAMIRSVFFLALLAGVTIPLPARAEPQFAVYKGNGCEGRGRIPRYEKVIGRKLDGVVDFFAHDSWASMQSDAEWALGCWHGQPYSMAIGVPLIVNGASLGVAAAGGYDDLFRRLGTTLVAKGQANAMLRLGWEFNGGWYPWSANRNPVAFRAAFRHVVTVLRSVPGQHFVMVWNPSTNAGNVAPQDLWPGDDVVDRVGLDVYNQSWRKQDGDPKVRWQGQLTANYGLNWVASFAAAHHKSIVIPEWGTGTRPDGHGWGDDALFIHNMAAWMRAHHVTFQGYWDFTASDYDATMSAGKFPGTLAAYKGEFGRSGH